MVDYNNIERRIAEMGVTKAFVSRKMGKSRSWLNSSRANSYDIPSNELCTLAAILETTPEYLRGETDNPSISIKKKLNLTEEELDRELIEMISRLTPEQEQLVRAFVAGIKATRKDGPSHRHEGRGDGAHKQPSAER